MARAQLIINADDFGYSRGINYAIMDAHLRGILTSTTLMANGLAFDHAIQISQYTPDLGIGCHLVLTHGQSLTSAPSLSDEEGFFYSLDQIEKTAFEIDLDELEQEWDAQIQKIKSAGIEITHLDSHHHIHSLPPFKKVFEKLALKYQLPVRNNADYEQDHCMPQRFETNFDAVALEPEHRLKQYFKNLLMDLQSYGSLEIMCHPGYIDQDLLEGSSLQETRARVAEFLQNSDFKEFLLQSNEISLCHFGDLKNEKTQ